MSNLPLDIVNKIMSYLPILDEKTITLNQNIRKASKILKLINNYAYFFNTSPNKKPSKAIICCATSWIYNDLSFFLNQCNSPTEIMVESYKDILYKVSNKRITTFSELEEYESKQYETIINLLFKHITFMNEDEIDEFITYCTNIYNL
tara:strand:+ start:3998 stop:4441 length:444 start_codon:yes stop_codon:yes gene_type:complete